MSTEATPAAHPLLSPESLAWAQQQADDAPPFDAEMRTQIARLLGTATTPAPAPAKSDAA